VRRRKQRPNNENVNLQIGGDLCILCVQNNVMIVSESMVSDTISQSVS